MIQQAEGLYNGTPYSIKFCTSFDTFEMERGIYTNPVLSGIVPRVAVVHDNNDNSFTDPNGVPMPPLVVLERGQAFDEWAKRMNPDINTVAKVLLRSHLRGRDCNAESACFSQVGLLIRVVLPLAVFL